MKDILDNCQIINFHGVWQVYYVMGTADSLVRRGRKRINNRMSSSELANLSNGPSLKALKFRNLLLSRIESMTT